MALDSEKGALSVAGIATLDAIDEQVFAIEFTRFTCNSILPVLPASSPMLTPACMASKDTSAYRLAVVAGLVHGDASEVPKA